MSKEYFIGDIVEINPFLREGFILEGFITPIVNIEDWENKKFKIVHKKKHYKQYTNEVFYSYYLEGIEFFAWTSPMFRML